MTKKEILKIIEKDSFSLSDNTSKYPFICVVCGNKETKLPHINSRHISMFWYFLVENISIDFCSNECLAHYLWTHQSEWLEHITK